MENPLPVFHLNKIIKVATEVCEGGRARICGREWGPANRHLVGKHRGWVYRLKEILPDGSEKSYPAGEGMGFEAGEDEIVSWGNQGM